MAEAPIIEFTASLTTTRRRVRVRVQIERDALPGRTLIYNGSGRPIFLIPISRNEGDDPQFFGTDDLVKKIPARDSIEVDGSKYNLEATNPAFQIAFLFRAGDTDNVEEFSRGLHFKGVELEPEDKLFDHNLLFNSNLYLECDEGEVIGDGNAGQISTSGDRLRSGMEYFREAQAVRLRSPFGDYLVAREDEQTVALCSIENLKTSHYDCRVTLPIEEVIASDRKKRVARRPFSFEFMRDEEDFERDLEKRHPWWSVESLVNSDSFLRLKSCYGTYLAASDEPSPLGMTGCLVHQTSGRDLSSKWEVVMEETRVKLRTHYGTFLCTNGDGPVTHDLPYRTIFPLIVEVIKRNEEGSATDIDHKASEGSATDIDIDDKASEGSASEDKASEGSATDTNIDDKVSEGSTSEDKASEGSTSEDKASEGSPTNMDDKASEDKASEGSTTNMDEKASEGSATDIDDKASEGSATDIDDKEREEGSAFNIDDKASSATKRHHETGEGSSVAKSPSGDSRLIREGHSVKFRHHFWDLKRMLLDNYGRKNILVTGRSGTTALVREVCADVWEHFDTVAWISSPQNNASALIREEILLQLIFERVAFPEDFDGKPLMLRDHELSLQQKARCLIVVDNLDDPKTWKKFEEILGRVETWQAIFINKREMGPLCSQIDKYGREFRTYELEGLSNVPRANHLKNFLKKCPQKGVCQLLLMKCQRLPIVFVLTDWKRRMQYRSSVTIKDEWEASISLDNLSHELQVIQLVLRILNKDLPENESLIQQMLDILCKDNRLFCFLYLSILPQNRPISCKRVIRLWAAEGILTDRKRADDFFDKLLQKKCIHSVEKRSDGELSTFQVDKRVREIIVSLTNLRDLVTITSPRGTDWPENVRFLSVRGTVRVFDGEKTFKLSSTFVLDNSSNGHKATTSEDSWWDTYETPLTPSDLESSKVLDLAGTPLHIVPRALFNVTNATYLGLGNSSIKAIPASIRKLTHLKFLDAKHSLVTKLPLQFAKLKKIRQILIYHHEREPLMESYNLIGFKALCRVEGFKDLEELCFVEADEIILEDLGNLTKLRRLGITKLRTEHGMLLRTSLGKLTQLKSLNLHALDEDEILDLHYPTSSPESKSQTSSPESKSQTSPPESLKHLYLHGRLKKLPDWILYLSNLSTIILRWSQLEVDLLETFGKFNKLVELQLCRACDVERLHFKKGQFPKLKILLLEELEGLKSMSLEEGTMPCLEDLTISRCQWLESIPSGIKHIPTIQKLTFFDMSHEFYEKVRAHHERGGYEIFKDIPEVYFKRWRAGHWETAQEENTDEAHCSH